MKTNMENMESEMDSLLTNVEGISSTSANINKKMATKRDKVDKLVRLRDLLKKLEFLFELPARLNQSIELVSTCFGTGTHLTSQETRCVRLEFIAVQCIVCIGKMICGRDRAVQVFKHIN